MPTLKLGQRVRLTVPVDRFLNGIVPAGETGTIVDMGDAGVRAMLISMDRHFDWLNEWKNCLQFMPEWGDDPDRDLQVIDRWRDPVETPTVVDPHAICAKWVAQIGLGFHPDTRGADYAPAMTPDQVADYDADMAALFATASDPYECAFMAAADAGLVETGTVEKGA
jgi:hypothetical protein